MATTHPQLNFASDKAIVGMIHVRALPGTPYHRLSVDRIVASAADEARVLAEAGCDALIIENMHDRPYLNRTVGPEIVAGMTAVAVAVRSAADLPLGVQVLGGANQEALAVAQAGGAGFVRVEGFVFAHVADEGLMPAADAGPLLRYRKQIGAEDIAIPADVKKKHASHSITADVDLAETARAAEFFGADAVVVTGIATGRPTDRDDVQCVAEAVDVPVAIGSGLTPENLACYWPVADLFIVGSFVKQDGVWSNPIDAGRLGAFMDAVAGMRAAKRVE
ncbi:MAG: BtpA/SgcQ family protein [Planctomycetota bacterium]|nr:BtpA/SgcQ family protein [Planctomycetota bacterium]